MTEGRSAILANGISARLVRAECRLGMVSEQEGGNRSATIGWTDIVGAMADPVACLCEPRRHRHSGAGRRRACRRAREARAAHPERQAWQTLHADWPVRPHEPGHGVAASDLS